MTSGCAFMSVFGNAWPATDAFDRAERPASACSGGFGNSSGKIGERANLVRRSYKVCIAAGIIEIGHVHLQIEAMISRMIFASANGIFFVTGRSRESRTGWPDESRSRMI